MPATPIDAILWTEAATGKGHPVLPDIDNRPWRQILSKSGYDPDAAFPGLMGPIFNVKAFGAVGDGVTNDRAAILAAMAAAVAGLGTVYLPAGTYLIDDELAITAPIGFIGAGMSNVLIVRSNLAGPILRLNSPTLKGMKVEGFTVRYSSVPGAGDSAAIGIQPDNFFQSELRNVQILQTYIGFGHFGTTGPWTFFSNTIDNLIIRDVYQTFIKVHVGSSGANTGNHWGTIYCNGRAADTSTIKSVHGPMVQLSTSDGETFALLNLEYANITAATPRLVQIERGSIVFDHVHIEGIQSDAFANLDFFGIFPGASNKAAVVVNSIQVNALSLANISSWTNIFQLGGDNISVLLTGFVEKQGGSVFGGNGLRPAWTNGTRANNSFRMLEWQAPSLVLNTAGLLSSTAPIAHIELFGSAILNFAAPGAVPGLTAALTIAVPGVAVGDRVEVGASVVPPANFLLPQAWVSAAGTVSVAWFQFAGGAADPDGAGATYSVKVTKQ